MVDTTPLLYLRLLRDDLYDLDVEDIKDDLIRKPVFSLAEMGEILQETNEKLRLDLIFTLLEQKLHKGQVLIVKQFLEVLEPFYDWIVERYTEDVKSGQSGPIIRYRSYRNNTTVPSIDELNVFRREQIWKIQKFLKQLKHGVSGQRYLFVYGGFGTGKLTLVSQACENFSIVEHMGFHIFYLSLANCKTDAQILEQLENLNLQMGNGSKSEDVTYNGRYPTNEIFFRKKCLIQSFEESFKHSLLILSHVRDSSLIEKFDLKCKTLVVTSSKDVINKVNENERFVVKLELGFTEDESMELFGKALRLKSGHLPPEAHKINRMCKGNPFVIKLIARKMSEYADTCDSTASNTHVAGVWKKLAHDLGKHSITIENSTIRSILDQLDETEQNAFRSLVIFRDNVKIPHSVLQRYWDLPAEKTEFLTSKLINKGLLEKRVLNQSDFYMLHFVCYNFLLKEKPGESYANLHQRLVESYRISDALCNRTELDLLKFFPNDHYFHFYIAIHLEQSGSHDLFPKLFTDFGFLEQKVRYTGLPNTVGDLKLFQERIFVHMRDPEFYAEMLTEFLMGAEVLLSKSADTCLLQLALNCTGLIADEAKLQAAQYNNRVWFCDIDHTHQHQLIQVRSAPHKVRLQDPESALVSLDNNQISLVDLSPWYSAPATIFDGNEGRVMDMQMINNVLIALDDQGTLSIWSMKNTPQDRNARQLESDGNIRTRTQSLRPSDHDKDHFVSFCIVCNRNNPADTGNTQTDLFAITRNGILYFYRGISHFLLAMHHDTKIKNAYMIKPLIGATTLPKLLFLTEDSLGCIFNLSSTSIECRFNEPRVVNIHNLGNRLISVCPNQIRLRTFCRDHRNQLQTEREEVIYATPKHHQNTCSAISDDDEYIVLGTTQGISIFSIRDRVEVLRTNISHNILDVDIYSLDDVRYRYILISSSEDSGNVINMYSLMVTANNQMVSNQYQLQSDTNFLVDLDHEPVRVKTVDRKRVIQELQFSTVQERDDFNKLSPTSENAPLVSEVQQLIQTPSGFYIGLKNGDILRLKDWCNPIDGPIPEVLLRMGKPVSLLKYYDAVQVLVAATESICMIIIEGNVVHQITEEICECYMHLDRYLVLIYENCTVEIFNVQSKDVERTLGAERKTFGASAFNEQCLVICTTVGAIEQLRFNPGEDGLLEIHVQHIYHPTENSPPKWSRISSCAISAQGELIAIGYKHGAIEVYNTEERKAIATLESHKYEVASLYFSPWQDPNSPHILVSIGEQIVFWNLDYVLNNPRLDSNDFKRRSNRYKSRPSVVSPAIDIHHRSSFGSRSSGLASPLAGSPARNGSFTFDIDEAGLQWLSKVGPSNKPQLLSCIKLIGSSAKKLMISRDFNKFFTIDDEGYLYYLRLFQPDRNRLTISFETPIKGHSTNGSFLI